MSQRWTHTHTHTHIYLKGAVCKSHEIILITAPRWPLSELQPAGAQSAIRTWGRPHFLSYMTSCSYILAFKVIYAWTNPTHHPFNVVINSFRHTSRLWMEFPNLTTHESGLSVSMMLKTTSYYYTYNTPLSYVFYIRLDPWCVSIMLLICFLFI